MSDDIVSAGGIGVRYGRRRARGRRAVARSIGGLARAAGSRTRARRTAHRDAAPAHALEAVDLECRAGEIVGVLGPNGAGKSTLLRVLATVLRPTAGTLRLFGSPARPTPDLRRRLGHAADTAAHFDALSGRENAIFFARAAGLDAARAARAVDPLLERFALADDARRAVREYSFGMRRKLALAEALAHEPDLILLDEPTVGLDPRALHALRELLRERANTGTTVVTATNDVREAQELCDRVVFLHRGRVALEGEPDVLLRRSRAHARVHATFRVAGERAAPSDGVGATNAPPEAARAVAGEPSAAGDLPAAAGESAGPAAVVAAAGAVDGAELIAAGPDRLLFHAARGGAALPDICRALLDAGAEILSVDVREPDLRDVFYEATGEALEAAAADAGDERRGARAGGRPATSERAPDPDAVGASGP